MYKIRCSINQYGATLHHFEEVYFRPHFEKSMLRSRSRLVCQSDRDLWPSGYPIFKRSYLTASPTQQPHTLIVWKQCCVWHQTKPRCYHHLQCCGGNALHHLHLNHLAVSQVLTCFCTLQWWSDEVVTFLSRQMGVIVCRVLPNTQHHPPSSIFDPSD